MIAKKTSGMPSRIDGSTRKWWTRWRTRRMPDVSGLRNNCAELRGELRGIARLEDEEDADATDDAGHHGEQRLGLQ